MDRFLTTNDLSVLLARKPATIARKWREWQKYGFPNPICAPPHSGRLLWLESQIADYMAKIGKSIANDAPKPLPKLFSITSNSIDNDLFMDLINF